MHRSLPRPVVVALAAVALCAGFTPSSPTTGASASASAALPAAVRPPVPLPADPSGLEAPVDIGPDIDPPASYQGQETCVATALRGVVKLRRLVLTTYERGGESPARPRACSSGGQSEHKEGRAWDWMVDVGTKADRSAAADFLSWLTRPGPSGEPAEMASRLGVMYVIYNRKSWSSYTGYWRDYTGYDPHTSHVHISLSWNGARAHTSFWTGRVWATDLGSCRVFTGHPAVVPPRRPRTVACKTPVSAPRTSSQPFAWLGSTGSAVTAGQRRLGIDPTGAFDARTRLAVLRYQRAHDLPPTGALDDVTWASLMPTAARTTAPSWSPAAAAAWARDKAGAPSLRRHDAGLPAFALQVALRLPRSERNGYFGAQTAAAVKTFKQSVGLPANARVNADVWAGLPQR